MYSQDYDENYPRSAAAFKKLTFPYVKDNEAYTSPLDAPGTESYKMNPALQGKYSMGVKDPSRTVMIYEGTPGKFAFRHLGGTNIGFVDGHVKLMRPAEAAKVIWNPIIAPHPRLRRTLIGLDAQGHLRLRVGTSDTTKNFRVIRGEKGNSRLLVTRRMRPGEEAMIFVPMSNMSALSVYDGTRLLYSAGKKPLASMRRKSAQYSNLSVQNASKANSLQASQPYLRQSLRTMRAKLETMPPENGANLRTQIAHLEETLAENQRQITRMQKNADAYRKASGK